MAARNASIKNYKHCIICNAEFYASPSSKKITCNATCESKRRSSSALQKLKIHQLALKEGAEKSPILQPDEKHCNAKEWILISPDGTRHECRNLAHWARENIGKDWENFRAGISKIRATAEGRKHFRKSYSYMGWTVVI